MTYQDVNEPVSVIALYERGRIEPIRIKWRERVYHIAETHRIWTEPIGGVKYMHIAVSAKESGDAFELVIDPCDLSWRLARVSLPG